MNATHCLCYATDLAVTLYNLSATSLQRLADQPASTQSTDGDRTISNIVWSSLTTIFACTWAACHPNIAFEWKAETKPKVKVKNKNEDEDEKGATPGTSQAQLEENRKKKGDEKRESWCSRFWKYWWLRLWELCCPSFQTRAHIKIFLVALIAPECIVMWAIRQYRAAWAIGKRFEGVQRYIDTSVLRI